MKVNKYAEKVTAMLLERNTRIETVTFSQVSRDLKSCLVCMPGKLELVRPAAEILPEIAVAFPNRMLKVLITSSIDPMSHSIMRKFMVIRADPNDIDHFSLPRKHFIKKLIMGGVGIVIDLDTAPNFFNQVIALRTGAEVRTTFDKGIGLPYYNFIVSVDGENPSLNASYRAMADVLGNFRL